VENNNYKERLHKVIPGGAHTYSRGDDQFPQNAPEILKNGLGAYVWDAYDNKFLDYGMALRAVTLGYSHPDINKAVCAEINKGNNLTRASLTELEAAELIVDLIPGADMVKFAKNGSNVTTGAAKIARSFTGRKYICVPKQHPFFSFDDWFIGTTPVNKGIPSSHFDSTLIFEYGKIETLNELFNQYPDQIAAVMLEPATTLLPCSTECNSQLKYNSTCSNCLNKGTNFLHQVKQLCVKNNALLILDEMITGFRFHLQGAQTYFGVEPDISTFGKGMANGFSVAAITGKKEIMEVGSILKPGAERTFLLSTTHGGEMSGLRAFIETINVYKKQDVCKHIWEYGAKLKSGFKQITDELGISNNFYFEGSDALMNYLTKDKNGDVSTRFRTLYSQEMIKNGVLMPWVSVSLAHTDAELNITLEAARKALKVYSEALNTKVENYLVGDAVKPVFRKFN
jgi:glutamate-1-semialdehyde 2,1-aminomutase